jgi:hypothetical protein
MEAVRLIGNEQAAQTDASGGRTNNNPILPIPSSSCAGNPSPKAVNVGDITQQVDLIAFICGCLSLWEAQEAAKRRTSAIKPQLHLNPSLCPIQNLLNDLDTAYLLLPEEETRRQKPWMGGLNMTALVMLEQRAYGSYHLMLNTTPSGINPAHVVLNYTTSGTLHGLSKMPYARDSRRAIGDARFRLMYPGMDYYNVSSPDLGFRYQDGE